jgi:hypothetical protein
MNRTCNEPRKNKAKLGQDGTSGGRRAREGAIVQNEANSPAAPGGRGPRGWGTRGNCAKQTQCPDCGFRTDLRRDTAWGPMRANRATTPRCPVSFRQQSQFPAGRGDEACGARGVAQTNPIPALCRSGDRRSREGNSAKQTQFRPGRAGRGLGDEGRTCEAKPIGRRGSRARR